MMSKTFEHRSQMPGSVQALVEFHEDPRALSRLSMPPTFIQVLRDERTSLTAGRIAFRLWLGPLPVRWVAEHVPGPTEMSFTDRMVEGPMAYWEHQHIFEAAEHYIGAQGGVGWSVHAAGVRRAAFANPVHIPPLAHPARAARSLRCGDVASLRGHRASS
jgi:ligand-binding SRPBCC domain-containing protein